MAAHADDLPTRAAGTPDIVAVEARVEGDIENHCGDLLGSPCLGSYDIGGLAGRRLVVSRDGEIVGGGEEAVATIRSGARRGALGVDKEGADAVHGVQIPRTPSTYPQVGI